MIRGLSSRNVVNNVVNKMVKNVVNNERGEQQPMIETCARSIGCGRGWKSQLHLVLESRSS